MVVGLDAAPPELVFHKFRDILPNLGEMLDRGAYGELESCHPPITIPAWAVLATGKNPGKLGLYGFRYRRNFSYTEQGIATSLSVREPALWEVFSDQGHSSCLVGVPPSYPPRPLNGNMISCFITPSAEKAYTYPLGLKREVERLVGRYLFDVEFRVEDRERLLRRLYEMTEKRFRVLNYLMEHKKWDFFMFVEIGLDRLHHAFWKFFDPQHPKYEAGNSFEGVIEDYYKYLDLKVGEMLKTAGKDTLTFAVSDHGVKGMKGAFCINQWLAEEGYLTFTHPPGGVVDLEEAPVDWEKTLAWGWGGYYARIFLNVKGREPRGVVDPGDYESLRDELAGKLSELRDPEGRRMRNRVFKPQQLYPELHGEPPDLLVYLDDLYWRSAGTVGHGSLYLSENDKGPDDAVHSMHGIYIAYDPQETLKKGRVEKARLLDVAPTILHLAGLPVPEDMEGRVLE
ncbi:alkaline phosphatase family protein [Candidatus Hecatella orcuttiae]|uniref:alkaline phosphatase family protein n=1 Tax=Candidatus Hecatella orcuttiae TaxID=1935119 RepID=UPI00286831EE|nr:alkaline phosphatase family protein [Candidatus Hecatella orcuttiae]